MAGFGSEYVSDAAPWAKSEGLRDFETGGRVRFFEKSRLAAPLSQKSENAVLGQKMPFVDGHKLVDNNHDPAFFQKRKIRR